MKKTLRFCFRSLILLGAFLMLGKGAYANHILGMDLNYTWVSDSTYRITLIAYGDCGGANFNTLQTATPFVCVFNNTTAVTTLTLTLQAPTTGTEITPVCISSIGQTTCTSPTMTIPGVKKFVYTANYRVPSRSALWRFVFNGYMGAASQPAGRATVLTNVNATSGSVYVQLTDTLNNTGGIHNSSPDLTVIPTPYYCLNNDDNYNPGALDADADSLRFDLITGKIGTGSNACTGAGGSVTYMGGHTGPDPLAYNAGTFVFDPATGQIQFNPNAAQRALVVYNVREYRGGVLRGTSQREMTFLVQTCTNTPANGPISAASSGIIIDSTHYEVCQNTGTFSLSISPTESNPANRIKIIPTSVPSGSTFSVTGDSTATPTGHFSWTSTGTTPGTYTFFLYFLDDNCPIAGTNSVAYNITISPTPVIVGTTTVCAAATTALSSSNAPGGTWASANTAVATVVAGTGVVTGVDPGGTAVINYTSPAGCFGNTTVTVNPQPAIIGGNTTICMGSTTLLSDGTPTGTWSSSVTGVATVVAGPSQSTTVTGVSAGTTIITYRLTGGSGCSRTTPVIVTSGAGTITGPATVCANGGVINLSDATGGGTWTSSNTFATVSSLGVVTGQTAGTSVISYAIGTCITTKTITVNAAPVAITPVGAVSICVGGTTVLSDGTAGGTWSSSNTTIATVNNATRVVTGVGAGTVNISYTNAGGCFVIKTINVNTAPVAITPNPASVCAGLTVSLSDATVGGGWSSTNSTIATVDPVNGTVSGVTNGTVTISYAIGTCAVTSTVTVISSPAAIQPAAGVSICAGTSTQLSDTSPGGAWSSNNTSVANVNTAGLVLGVSAGVATITYSTGGCFVTKPVTVNTAPTAIIPTPAVVCVGTTKILSDAIGGGIWSSSNSTLATINAGGTVFGAAVGNLLISYSIGSCTVTASLTVNSAPSAGVISGPTSVCVGGPTITLSDSPGGGAWSSGSSTLATISAGGVVTGLNPGLDVISYTVVTACGTAVSTYSVTVSNSSGSGVIGGPSTICAGTFTILTETVPLGTWSASNGNATISSTGLLTGVTPGSVTISYTVTNACGSSVATKPITVGAFLDAGTISGATNLCAGSAATLSDNIIGGAWSSTNSSIATISGVGVVHAVSAGVTTISYLMISSCGSVAATYSFTVNPMPAAGTIIGPSTICAGTFSFLSDATPGGVWSSTNSVVATIDASGMINGVTAGTTTISYTFTNSCGTVAATQFTTVNPAPSVATILGPSVVCVGTTITLTDATSGGVWSSSNARATISPSGVVTGVSTGADTIYYTVTIACGTITTSKPINVNPALSAGTITGPSSVCVSSLIALSDSALGGVWSSSNGHATITTGGIVTGVTPGTDTISYSVFSSCGLVATTKIITIAPSSGAGTITGGSGTCPGNTFALSDAVPGGSWSVSSTSIATVSALGVVSGVAVGTDTVFYTVVSSCGTNFSYTVITITSGPSAGTITGPTNVCAGSSISLADATPGGVWSASNGNATVSGGLVSGITVGPVTISYTVTNSCGSTSATYPISVVTFPVVTLISGPSTVCVGSSITLTDATPGGVWTSTNTNATVSTGGVVTGVAAGTDIITYLVSNGCGTVGTSRSITINPVANAGTVTGPDSVCVGATITLVDLAPGGVWSAGNANATVSGGVVTGVSGGTVPISYSVTNICGTVSAVKIITIQAAPNAGTITGPSSVCVGSGITLVNLAPGGTWLSSNSNATFVAPGILDGVTVGTDTVFYLVNNACGAAVASKIIAVNPIPVVTAISGATSQCVGTVIALSDATPGGQWFSSNSSVAVTDILSGLTNGVSAGIVNITYTVTNGFGCPASAISPDTVIAVPGSTPITGSTSVCVNANVTLSNASTGGAWSSDNTLVATIDAVTGIVTGVSAGTATISYLVTNICGSAVITTTETVNPLPVIAAISGPAGMCAGASVMLSDATTGGAWSSSNTTVATVDAVTGMVSGVGAGVASINYTVTSPLGCSDLVSTVETVDALPSVATISGGINVCVGGSAPLSDATPGGTWSSDNIAIATVDPVTGMVSGVSGGATTISYSVTSGGGCTASATTPYTVSTMPAPTPVTGVMTVCVNATTTLSNSAAGGVWSNTTGNATVSITGDVTGVAAGTEYIIYTVTNACGSIPDSALITINPLPTVNPITTPSSSICAGTTVALTETTTGGVWSSSNTSFATVSSTGVVTGVAVGTASIMYSVTNSSGCIGTAATTITVGTAMPAAAVLPTGSATICNGNPVFMHVVSSGGTITYQWLQNGTPIPGATTSAYTTGTVGNFTVIIGNGTCSQTLTGTIVIGSPNPVISLNPPNMLYTGSFAHYQWYLNGVLIPGDTTGIIVENGAGNYTVVVTDANGCTDTSAAFSTVGVNIIDPENIRVYPNPAKSVLHIEAGMKVNVSVFGVDGKLVISQKDAVNINVHDLANGLYIIMIYDEDSKLLKTTKFAKTE